MFRVLKRILYKFIYPLSVDENLRRREFILNILLVGSMILSGLAEVSLLIRYFSLGSKYNGNSPFTVVVIFFLFLFLYFLSRKGYFILASYIFIALYFIPVLFATYTWSIYLPQAILTFSLLIIMAHILIGTNIGILVTVIISLVVIIVGYLESTSKIKFDLSWATTSVPSTADAVIYTITYMLITVVSALFNSEGEKALRRAQRSENALQNERNLLEVKVEQRTRQLRQLQIEKNAQMYRFAQYGKLASGFFHDFSNSVHLVSLNLNELKKRDIDNVPDVKDLLTRAQIGITHMQDFIEAAGKQINNQNIQEVFSVNEEIQQVINILSYKAKKEHVQILFTPEIEITLFGNPIKFHQMVSNLISNAIDAYKGIIKHSKLVKIQLKKDNDVIDLKIIDFGVGITPAAISRIFESFFTTKGYKKNLGLGLPISYEIVTKEFKGKITASSTKKEGTIFSIRIPTTQ